MKPSKRQMRLIAPSWAKALREHIASQPRGYQAQLARETGCSESMLNRIKGGKVGVSEWTAVIARYTGLPIPPLAVDDDDAEILELSAQLSAGEKQVVINMMRGLLEMGKTPSDSEH